MNPLSCIRRVVGTALLAAVLIAPAPPACAVEVLPDGFRFDQVGYGPFTDWGPSSFAFLPDGRIVMIELRTGEVRLNAVGANSSVLVYTIPNVWFNGERGLLGVAVDPGWPTRPYLYFYFSHDSSFNYLIMLTVGGDLTDPLSTNLTPGSRYDLLTDLPDDWINHNGGTLRFGPDGMLYVSLGDDGNGCGAQDLAILTGKILRLDVSGMPGVGGGPPPKAGLTPVDNPFIALGVNEGLVWAWGLRNPFRFTIDEPTGDLYIGDVGTVTWEEVNIAPFAGGGGENFAWPRLEGPDSSGVPGTCGRGNVFTAPAYVYPHSGATAIIGGPRYHPVAGSPLSFPPSYDGSVFIMEHFQGWMRRLVNDGSGWAVADSVPGQPSASNWAEGLPNHSDLQLGPDGALYLAHLHTQTSTPQGVFRIASDAATSAPTTAGATPSAVVVPNPALVSAGASFRWTADDAGRHFLGCSTASAASSGPRA
jgi:glucose/arabinose dehydrogenase